LTAIRKVTRKVRYKVGEGRIKNTYTLTRYRLEFPTGFPVSDLVGKELEFERVGDEIRLRPKKK